MKWNRSASSLFDDSRGTVFLEFLVVVVPLWVFFLCLVQLALFSHANLLVKHAADAAARSASVVLPDDPSEYGGEPAMTVSRGQVVVGESSADLEAFFMAYVDSGGASPASSATSKALVNLGRSRLNTIRLAAHVPLMPLAPTWIARDSSPSVRESLASRRSLVGSFYHQPFALAVTFPELSGNEITDPEITVRVTYAYACSIPVARNLLCSEFETIGSSDDFDRAFFPALQQFVGGRFRRFQHESTLLVHEAPYEYRPRGTL